MFAIEPFFAGKEKKKDEGWGLKDEKLSTTTLIHPSAFRLHPFLRLAIRHQ
jgi:hypothetical protein